MATQTESFGPYLLLRPLGRGGMGVVYTARSRHKNHPVVALKRLRADAAQVPSFRERFEHECALALRLQHPRLVQTLDAGEIDGVPYVASELVLGSDVGVIAERLKHQGRGAPVKIAVRITIDILSGLDYVHQAHEPDGESLRLVHRDVTPGNVLVGYDGLSRLADFGLAKSLLTEKMQLTAIGMILGTPKFVAPEVAAGSPAGPRADLYGLGAVIYRLMVGWGPYEGDAKEVLRALIAGPPRPLSDVRPDIPRWFSDVVESLMARSPEDRPASARGAGLHLVSEARRHEALMPRPRFAQWLKELFVSEHRAQMDQLKADMALDIDLVPTPSEGTRVIAQRKGPLEAPAQPPAQSDSDFEYDQRNVQASGNPSAISHLVEVEPLPLVVGGAPTDKVNRGAVVRELAANGITPIDAPAAPADPIEAVGPNTRTKPLSPAAVPGHAVLGQVAAGPTVTAWRATSAKNSAIPNEKHWQPDPAAATEVVDMAQQDTAIGTPLVLSEDEFQTSEGPTPLAWRPNVDIPTKRQLASPTMKFAQTNGVTNWFVVAIVIASLVGGLVGSQCSRRSDENEQTRSTLIDRLGRARHRVNSLRMGGTTLPDGIDEDIQRVRKQLLDSDDLTRVHVELQDLEITLDSLER